MCVLFKKYSFTITFSRVFLYTPFLGNYGQQMDTRQEKGSSEILLRIISWNQMGPPLTSLVIKGTGEEQILSISLTQQ